MEGTVPFEQIDMRSLLDIECKKLDHRKNKFLANMGSWQVWLWMDIRSPRDTNGNFLMLGHSKYQLDRPKVSMSLHPLQWHRKYYRMDRKTQLDNKYTQSNQLYHHTCLSSSCI